MFKHIVMWKFLEFAQGRTREENLKIFKEGLEALVPIIPEIISLEVGIDEFRENSSYDIVLVSVFKNKVDLLVYNNHPEHQKIAGFCAEVRESRIAVDYYL